MLLEKLIILTVLALTIAFTFNLAAQSEDFKKGVTSHILRK